MRVRLASEVFGNARSLRPILNVLECFTTGRHDWVADARVLYAARVFFERVAANLADIIAQLGEKAAVDMAWTAGETHVVDIGIDDLPDAVEDLCQPAVLVLEDLENDGNFVKALAHVFEDSRTLEAVDKGWIEIRHAGGDRLEVVARAERATFRRIIRIAALLDSDRWTPGSKTSNHDKADRLQDLGITVHVLRLREAENYVPNRILSGIGKPTDASAKLESLKRLNADQRGYYDMKHGFGPKSEPPKVRAEQAGLFAGVNVSDLIRLREGFGRKVLLAFYENRKRLKPADFSGIGAEVEQELRGFLAKVNRII